MRIWMLVLALVCCLSGSAQSADNLYKQGKALYDAKDYAKAFVKLKAAAEKGHKKAQYRVGLCYDKGKGVKENDDEAFRWYSKSAAQNYAKAQYQLGKCYKEGEGCKEDRSKALAWWLKAAKQDNADAEYQLAKAYLKGKGVAADEAKAKSWIKKAVRNEKDGDEILQKLRKDAAAGDEDAKKLLAFIKK